ncbi:alkylhydroperoxidase AhpD family core domain-containing protein [Reichenbachiella faecimaris]|uniref:Alkylhydroperoxidase AhpD family core domain-containing protein n=1 Tax=Reichenbachiella faecimaris TaxID=692418 RepID=A0A1W2G9V2_REIFA|nr:carboxymuconolactone decarboxylase family protein [Reichenbachiella faecimaris]SMD33086.1 alkylhydroperoxidase AhpD family core domain-containing protein [Reichenbachiella faecimaris]
MERISFQNIPEGLYNGLYQMGEYLDHSGLDKQLQMLVEYRVSQINSCAFCLDMHFKEAVESGESTVRLSMVSAWKETELFSEVECVVLQFAEAVTLLSNNDIGEDIYASMRKYFDPDQIAAWTLAIVRINGWNRFMKAFKTKAGAYKIGQFA